MSEHLSDDDGAPSWMMTFMIAHLIICRGRVRRYNRKKVKSGFDLGGLIVDFAIDVAFLLSYVPHVVDA